ncbi:MAG TPA: rhodanese-like domain-containing protein [Pirellulales bacterium]|nr:rhodanese-like domain-containing protein [Pirellulales bacterium]
MDIPEISADGLAARCRQCSKVELIDVRTPAEFREVHVEFARNIPLDQLTAETLAGTCPGADHQPVYVVCQSGSRGLQACQRLLDAGWQNVINVSGGTVACVKAGFPVVRGKKQVSLERQVRIAAGSIVLLGIALSSIHPAFLGISAFIGVGLVFAGITDTCGMGLLLAKMPWNRCAEANDSCGFADRKQNRSMEGVAL